MKAYFKEEKKLGIKTTSSWTKDEENILIKYFPNIGYKVVKMLPGRNETQIRGKVDRMGLKINKFDKWSSEELKRFPELYSKYGRKCVIYFEGKTKNDVARKAQELGISYSGTWSETERKILIENYENTSQQEMLSLLPNKSWSQIETCYKRIKYNKIAI